MCSSSERNIPFPIKSLLNKEVSFLISKAARVRILDNSACNSDVCTPVVLNFRRVRNRLHIFTEYFCCASCFAPQRNILTLGIYLCLAYLLRKFFSPHAFLCRTKIDTNAVFYTSGEMKGLWRKWSQLFSALLVIYSCHTQKL